MARRQGIFWICTLASRLGRNPSTELPGDTVWAKGQEEIGDGGFRHWQFIVAFRSKKSIRGLQEVYPGAHAELTRSSAADLYVWKDDTAVDGTRFELGTKPINRASS